MEFNRDTLWRTYPFWNAGTHCSCLFHDRGMEKLKGFRYSWVFVCVSEVFTEDSVKKEAADLWNQIPEPVQKVYTKEFYDNVIRDMLKHSTMGVST